MPVRCVAPLEMNEGNYLGEGQGYNRPTGCGAEKAPHETFNFLTASGYRLLSVPWAGSGTQPVTCSMTDGSYVFGK